MNKQAVKKDSKFDTVSNLQISAIKKVIDFVPALNTKTIKWIKDQHLKIGIRAKLLVDNAINIGMILYYVQSKNSREFVRWIESNFDFTVKTAYRYILLYTYKDKLKEVENLNEAYRITNKFLSKKKEKEDKKSEQRVIEYKKTGKKPKNWRRGTDDKKAKAIDQEETVVTTEKQKKVDKEDIDISIDTFIESLDEFVSGLSNKSFKIVACQNIIKRCKSIMEGLV
jgi:hypothetical protein